MLIYHDTYPNIYIYVRTQSPKIVTAYIHTYVEMPDTRVHPGIGLTWPSRLPTLLVNYGHTHMHVRVCHFPVDLRRLTRSSMMTWSGILISGSHNSEPLIMWSGFPSDQLPTRNQIHRALPYGRSTSIQTLLQIDVIVIT